jgi:hypothetical protein
MCFFGYFDSIPHQWQMMACGSIGTRNSKTAEGIAATAYLRIQDMDHDQYRLATIGKNTCAHTCGASPVICLHSSPVANDGLWVKEEQGRAKQWWALQQPHICNFRAWITINIDQLHHLKISWPSYKCLFSHFDSINQQWQMMASGSKRNKQQQNSGGNCSNRIFVNSRHGY